MSGKVIKLDLLQDAIGEILAGLDGLEKVLAYPDPQAPFPYALIGADEDDDEAVQFETRRKVWAPIHFYTQEPGFTQCKRITNEAIALLDGASIEVAGAHVLSCFFKQSRFMRDPEPGVAHGVAEFEIRIRAAA